MLLPDELRQELYDALLNARVDEISNECWQIAEFGYRGMSDLSERELINAAFEEIGDEDLLNRVEAHLAIEEALEETA